MSADRALPVALDGVPVLRTERLVLRAPRAADWPHWQAFFTSERARFVAPAEVDDRTAWRAFGHFVGHWVLRGFGSFVFQAHDDPTPLGSAGPWFPEGWPEPEIGWTIWTAAAEGRGLAAEAARVARVHAFVDLGWARPVSYIDPANARSIALAERLGAVRDRDAAAPGADDLVYRHPDVTPEAA